MGAGSEEVPGGTDRETLRSGKVTAKMHSGASGGVRSAQDRDTAWERASSGDLLCRPQQGAGNAHPEPGRRCQPAAPQGRGSSSRGVLWKEDSQVGEGGLP